MNAQRLPRSIRNSNPLNIDHNPANKWLGILPVERRNADQLAETRFEVFESLAYGFRAAAVLLQNYQDKYGLNTIEQLISRWAPSVENDTKAYAHAVSYAVGVRIDDVIDVHQYDYMRPLIEAMAVHETGKDPRTGKLWKFDPAVIDEGLRRAGIVRPVKAPVPASAETVAAAGAGAVGIAQVADALPAVASALEQADPHISSGSVVRITFGVLTVALAAWIAWSQVKRRRTGAA